MANKTDARTPALLLDGGFECENGTASVPSSGLRSKYALFASVSALGLVIGVLGCLVMTPDAATTGLSKGFVAPGMPASSQVIADPRMSSPVMGPKRKPLSPGSNFPTTKNVQTQSNGFGTWLQKFQIGTQSKYGVPLYLESGAINPEYLAKERAEMAAKKKAPLSPGSNYPTTNNIQTQKSGFGNFLQKFQTSEGKSKYGVPIFLPNGNVNPAYLAAERKEQMAKKKLNVKAAEDKRKKLIAKGDFELAGYIRKKIGNVGSGKDYYQSGK